MTRLVQLAVGALLEPEHAEVVTRRRDDVVAAVAVDVEHVHESELGHSAGGAAGLARRGAPPAAVRAA